MQTIEEKLEEIKKLTLLSAKDVFNMRDAAAYTGLSMDYLYRLVSKRQIPHYKSDGGKLTYFSKSELCAWLLKNRVNTTEEAHDAAVTHVIVNPARKGGLK